jgi:hypothetical protein
VVRRFHLYRENWPASGRRLPYCQKIETVVLPKFLLFGGAMNLLESILNANDGGVVRQLASQFGLHDDQASSAVQSLLPALAGGLQRNISQGGLTDLIGALSSGQHERYLDDPSALSSDDARNDGNGILGHIVGGKDVSRRVAAQASAQTGISDSILKQMLPAIAALAMGAMSRRTTQSRAAASGRSDVVSGSGPAAGSDILGMLTPLLDRDRNGSVVDDILGSVSRFFKK